MASQFDPEKDAKNVSHLESLPIADDKAQNHHVADTIAANYVDATLHISEDENKRLRRKIFKNLLPVMCVAYVTQALDKGTTGTASIMGWQGDIGAKGQDYALTSTFLWIGIIIGEPIVNQFIRKLPVAKILAGTMFVWTALLFGLSFAKSVPPVFVIRILLGLFESSFSPCLMTITVQWFVKEEQTMITTVWQAMFGLSNLISNILAYGFYHIPRDASALISWQWMTLTIALISLVASIIVWFFLPDSPVQARWASEEDKVKFVERVRSNDQGIKQKKWKSDQAWEVIKDPLVFQLCFMMLCQTLVVGGLNTFNSLLINQAFGFDVLTSQLVSIPLAAFQVCLYFLIGWLVTKTNQTVYCMIGYTTVNIIGTVVLLTVAPTTSTRPGLLVAFYLMQCFQSVSPSMYTLVSRNIAGQTKKSIVYAAFFVAWASGNAIGPQLFQSIWAPRYFNSLYIHLGIYGCFIINLLLMRLNLRRRNLKRDHALEATGGQNEHVNAFDDMTDLQNPDFRYSY